MHSAAQSLAEQGILFLERLGRSDRIRHRMNMMKGFGVASHLWSLPRTHTMCLGVGDHGRTITKIGWKAIGFANIFGVVQRTTPIVWVRRTIVKQYSIKVIGMSDINLRFIWTLWVWQIVAWITEFQESAYRLVLPLDTDIGINNWFYNIISWLNLNQLL